MKNTILCTFIALLSQSLFADERAPFDARRTAVTLEVKPLIKGDGFLIDYRSPITTAAPAALKAGAQNGSPQTIITEWYVISDRSREDMQKLEELIKERDQLKRLLTEMEALIQAPSKP